MAGAIYSLNEYSEPGRIVEVLGFASMRKREQYVRGYRGSRTLECDAAYESEEAFRSDVQRSLYEDRVKIAYAKPQARSIARVDQGIVIRANIARPE